MLQSWRIPHSRDFLLSFLILFGVLASHSMLETARDSLFLTRLPASQLPWVYLAMAIATLALARMHTRHDLARHHVLSLTLLAGAVGTGLLCLGIRKYGDSVLYVFYVWCGLLSTLSVAQFWALMGDRFSLAQAKMAYGKIGAGGLLGATVGSLLASLLLQNWGTNTLPFFSVGLLAVTAILPQFLSRQQGQMTAASNEERSSFKLVWNHPFLHAVLILVIAGTASLTLMDILFKTYVKEQVSPSELPTFFALLYAILNGSSLLIQLFGASTLIRRFGVQKTLWILPALISVCAFGFLGSLSLIPLIAMKFFDGSLRHSINNTSRELLYVPLGPILRARAKTLIDAVANRGGQAGASLLALGALTLGASAWQFAVLLILMTSFWLYQVHRIRKPYLDLFREQLRTDITQAELDMGELDLQSLETLLASLNSNDEQHVLNALDLLEQWKRVHLIPALILYHPSKDVVLRAFEVMRRANRRDYLPVARRVFEVAKSVEVRAAAFRIYTSVCVDEQLMRQALDDPSREVQVNAVVALYSRGLLSGSDAEQMLEGICTTSEEQRELARAIRAHWSTSMLELLRALIGTPDPSVKAELARLLWDHPNVEFLPALIEMLAYRESREPARRALLRLEDAALTACDKALSDPQTSERIRRHLPRTLSRFSGARSVEILLGHLSTHLESPIGYKILRGLGRILNDEPDRCPDRAVLDPLLELQINRLIFLGLATHSIRLNGGTKRESGRILLRGISEARENGVERLFRILGMRYPWEDLHKIYLGLKRSEKSVSSSRELLEHLLPPNVRELVLILLEPTAFDGPEIPLHPQIRPANAESIEVSLILDPLPSLQILGTHYLRETRPAALKQRLETLPLASHPLVREWRRQILERILKTEAMAS